MPHLELKTVRYESLPSTNTEAARLANLGAAEGLTVIADEQTAGRGRLQRSWSSPKGAGLYFSILLRPEIRFESWPVITFVAALAASDALSEASEIQTDIKWPNDLLAGERKICGILSESVDTSQGRAVVVGIGINLKSEAYPPELAGMATSVAEEAKRPADKERVLAALQHAMARWYSLLHERGGVEKILATWISRSSYASGRIVDIVDGKERFQGITRGLERDGALRVETEVDGIRIVRAGDVVSLRKSVGAKEDCSG